MLYMFHSHQPLRNSGSMKFSPRKAVLAGPPALPLPTPALPPTQGPPKKTAKAPVGSSVEEFFGSSGNTDSTKEKGTDATAKNKESNTDGSSTPAGSSAEGEGKGGFDFNKLNQVLKAISGVVGAASTIFAFLKSLKLI